MGDTLEGGRGSTQVVVIQPGGPGRAAEVVGIINVGRGDDPAEAIANSGFPTGRNTLLFPIERESGPRLTTEEFEGSPLSDIGINPRTYRQGSFQNTAAGRRAMSNSDIFAQLGARSSAQRRADQAAGRANRAADFNRTRTRVLRQTRGQTRRQRQGALRDAGIPSRFLARPVRASDINRGSLS